jgi:hypothetical protein
MMGDVVVVVVVVVVVGYSNSSAGEHGTRTLFFFSFLLFLLFPSFCFSTSSNTCVRYHLVLFSSAFIIIIAWGILLESISRHHVQLKRGTGATRGILLPAATATKRPQTRRQRRKYPPPNKSIPFYFILNSLFIDLFYLT